MEIFFTILLNLGIVAIPIWIVVAIIKEIKQIRTEEKEEQKEKLKEQERRRSLEKRRNAYYNNLHNIYDNLSIQTLRRVHSLLSNMVMFSPQPFSRADEEQLNIWAESRKEFLKLINPYEKCLWKTSYDSSYIPIWAELDLKYVYNLLNKR